MKDLGELLKEEGVLDQAGLKKARAHQRRTSKRLGEALLELQLVTEDQLFDVIARRLEVHTIPEHKLLLVDIPFAVIDLIPAATARKLSVLPLLVDAARTQIAVVSAEPNDPRTITAIRQATGISTVKPYFAKYSALRKVLAKYHGPEASVNRPAPRPKTPFGAAIALASREEWTPSSGTRPPADLDSSIWFLRPEGTTIVGTGTADVIIPFTTEDPPFRGELRVEGEGRGVLREVVRGAGAKLVLGAPRTLEDGDTASFAGTELRFRWADTASPSLEGLHRCPDCAAPVDRRRWVQARCRQGHTFGEARGGMFAVSCGACLALLEVPNTPATLLVHARNPITTVPNVALDGRTIANLLERLRAAAKDGSLLAETAAMLAEQPRVRALGVAALLWVLAMPEAQQLFPTRFRVRGGEELERLRVDGGAILSRAPGSAEPRMVAFSDVE